MPTPNDSLQTRLLKELVPKILADATREADNWILKQFRSKSASSFDVNALKEPAYNGLGQRLRSATSDYPMLEALGFVFPPSETCKCCGRPKRSEPTWEPGPTSGTTLEEMAKAVETLAAPSDYTRGPFSRPLEVDFRDGPRHQVPIRSRYAMEPLPPEPVPIDLLEPEE